MLTLFYANVPVNVSTSLKASKYWRLINELLVSGISFPRLGRKTNPFLVSSCIVCGWGKLILFKFRSRQMCFDHHSIFKTEVEVTEVAVKFIDTIRRISSLVSHGSERVSYFSTILKSCVAPWMEKWIYEFISHEDIISKVTRVAHSKIKVKFLRDTNYQNYIQSELKFSLKLESPK